MTSSQAERDRRYLRTPRGRYQVQKRNAVRRGIPWQISFAEWWDVWVRSGKWKRRGAKVGRYCMGRTADSGAYRVENVSIVTWTRNAIERNSPRGWSARVGSWFDLEVV